MPNLNHDYEIARNGGRHSGLLKNYVDLPLPMVERGIRSIETQITLHETWIKNPFSKLPATIEKHQVEFLVTKKWPKDIERLQEEMEVLKGLIKERENDS